MSAMRCARTILTLAEQRELAAVEALRAALSAQLGAEVTVGRANRGRDDPAFEAVVSGRRGPLSYDGPLGALRALAAGHFRDERAEW